MKLPEMASEMASEVFHVATGVHIQRYLYAFSLVIFSLLPTPITCKKI